ncbi:hypothetical protein GF342_02605 [Candidatus Woesearchaeota archaeon]|nr:hypothetical protein [Candidatus Woesearchaeota archaeon]
MARQHIGMSGFDYSNLPAGALFQALVRVLRDRRDERADRRDERDAWVDDRADERRQFYTDRDLERRRLYADRNAARRLADANHRDERDAWMDALADDRADRRDERDAWLTVDERNRRDLGEARQYVHDLVGDLVDALVEVRYLDRQIADYERRIEEVEQELSDERANVVDLEIDLMHEQRNREQLETNYAFAERERDRATEDLETAREQLGLTRDELSRLAGYVAERGGLASPAPSGSTGAGSVPAAGAAGAMPSGGGSAMTDLTDMYRQVWGGLAGMSGGGSAARATLPRRPQPRGQTRWSRLPEPSVLNFWLKRAYNAYANGDASTAAGRFATLDLPDMTAKITYARSLLDLGTPESREKAQRIYADVWRAADAGWRGIIENDLEVFSNKAGFRAPFAIPFLSRINSQASETFQRRSLEWMAEAYLQQDRPDAVGARSCYECLLDLPLSTEERQDVVRKLTRIARFY